jgi:hypothetical protein
MMLVVHRSGADFHRLPDAITGAPDRRGQIVATGGPIGHLDHGPTIGQAHLGPAHTRHSLEGAADGAHAALARHAFHG